MATWELDPTEKPDNRPLSTAAYVIRLNTSITITNKSGDKGSPCRRPRELRKNPEGDPFILMEKQTVEIA
jgi:hypothetical protein